MCACVGKSCFCLQFVFFFVHINIKMPSLAFLPLMQLLQPSYKDWCLLYFHSTSHSEHVMKKTTVVCWANSRQAEAVLTSNSASRLSLAFSMDKSDRCTGSHRSRLHMLAYSILPSISSASLGAHASSGLPLLLLLMRSKVLAREEWRREATSCPLHVHSVFVRSVPLCRTWGFTVAVGRNPRPATPQVRADIRAWRLATGFDCLQSLHLYSISEKWDTERCNS